MTQTFPYNAAGVAYLGGWYTGGGQKRADDSGVILFAFTGTSCSVTLNKAAGTTVSYRMDGGAWTDETGTGAVTLTVAGAEGRHTVEIVSRYNYVDAVSTIADCFAVTGEAPALGSYFAGGLVSTRATGAHMAAYGLAQFTNAATSNLDPASGYLFFSLPFSGLRFKAKAAAIAFTGQPNKTGEWLGLFRLEVDGVPHGPPVSLDAGGNALVVLAEDLDASTVHEYAILQCNGGGDGTLTHVVLGGTGAEFVAEAVTETRDTWLFVGDSITATYNQTSTPKHYAYDGWCYKLAQKLGVRPFISGHSGANTLGIAGGYQTHLAQTGGLADGLFKAVVVEAGVNDADDTVPNVAAYCQSFYSGLLAHTKIDAAATLFITSFFPCVGHGQASVELGKVAAIAALDSPRIVGLLEMTGAIAASEPDLQPDLLHVTPSGNTKVADFLFPLVGGVAGDTTGPVFSSASVDTTGLVVSVLLTEAESLPCSPASGVTGFTVKVAGVSRSIAGASLSGSTVTLMMASTIYAGQMVTVSYAPGNVTDHVGNALAPFTDQPMTNGSTQAEPSGDPDPDPEPVTGSDLRIVYDAGKTLAAQILNPITGLSLGIVTLTESVALPGYYRGGLPAGAPTLRPLDVIYRDGTAIIAVETLPAEPTGAGAGARAVTITVSAEGVPVPGALVRLSSGLNTFTSQTDADGQAAFAVDDGTYTLAITRGGYTYRPSSHVIHGDATIAAALAPLPFLPASAPNLTVGYCTTCDGHGHEQPNVTLRFRKLASGSAGTSYSGSWFEATSDGNGLLQVELVKASRYVGQRGSGQQVEFTTATDDVYALPETLSGVRGGVQ